MTALALCALALAFVLVAGGCPRATAASDVLGRWAGGWLAGAVLLHFGLTLLAFVAVPWQAATLLPLGLALALLWRRLAPGSPWRGELRRPGWGLPVAAAPVALYAAFCERGLAQAPDFVYHWGLKAARFVGAGGIDPALLARPDGWRIHTDYPQLVPELLGLPGFLTGRFDEGAALLLSVAIAVLTVLALRFALRSHGVAGFALEAATAIGALATAGFGAIYGMAGNADGLLAFALLAGVAGLLRLAAPAGQATVGWAAALAAATKIEGVPLALLLVTTALAGRWRARRASGATEASSAPGAFGAAELVRLAVPAVLVVLPWWLASRGRFAPSNFGPPRWGDLGVVLAGLGRSAVEPAGGCWPFLLLLLPWVARARRLRAAAALVGAQALLYVALYLVSPLGLERLIATTGARLLSHLVPAALLLAVLRGAERVYPEPLPAPPAGAPETGERAEA